MNQIIDTTLKLIPFEKLAILRLICFQWKQIIQTYLDEEENTSTLNWIRKELKKKHPEEKHQALLYCLKEDHFELLRRVIEKHYPRGIPWLSVLKHLPDNHLVLEILNTLKIREKNDLLMNLACNGNFLLNDDDVRGIITSELFSDLNFGFLLSQMCYSDDASVKNNIYHILKLKLPRDALCPACKKKFHQHDKG